MVRHPEIGASLAFHLPDFFVCAHRLINTSNLDRIIMRQSLGDIVRSDKYPIILT